MYTLKNTNLTKKLIGDKTKNASFSKEENDALIRIVLYAENERLSSYFLLKNHELACF